MDEYEKRLRDATFELVELTRRGAGWAAPDYLRAKAEWDAALAQMRWNDDYEGYMRAQVDW